MIVIEQRASSILYKFLVSNCKGRHFLMPANVCPVVPLTFLKANIDFSFVDIDPTTHAGSYKEYIDALKQVGDNNGILYVNAYGFKKNNTEFYSEIKRLYPNIVVIEDNCLCIPEVSTTEVKQFVDLEFYSNGMSKCAPLEKEGGYGLFDIDKWEYNDCNEEYVDTAYDEQRLLLRECRIDGLPFTYEDSHWLPLQLTSLSGVSSAEYLRRVSCSVNRAMKHKKTINDIYDKGLPDTIKYEGVFHNWRYMLMLPNHDLQQTILSELDKHNLYASAHYASVGFLFKKKHYPIAEKEASFTLNLFNEQKYTEEMAKQTVEIINNILIKYDKQRKI